ncbi:MAG TPA: NUDIX hydrolase [Candidatus Udaeobacter sp.]|nr:NUDIX hydrolase [Candidatus Udaeobacter sp.]
MPGEARGPWRRLASRLTYENAWIRVREDQVLRPDTQPGIYGVVEVKSIATGVVPLDAEQHTYLVGQYRYPLDEYSWEIPEGGGAPEVDPRLAAERELREETGLVAGTWDFLARVHLSNSITDEVGFVYVARDLRQAGPSTPEGTEELEVRRLPFAEALEMALAGRITDSLSVIGLLLTERWLRGERFQLP